MKPYRQIEDIEPLPVRRRILRLELERRKRGMNQVALARYLGTIQERISKIERGRQRPGKHLTSRLAKAFNVKQSAILFREVR